MLGKLKRGMSQDHFRLSCRNFLGFPTVTREGLPQKLRNNQRSLFEFAFGVFVIVILVVRDAVAAVLGF